MSDYNQIPEHVFTDCKTIAVVGLSPKPDRPSYGVAQAMQLHGYRIIPVNPTCAGTTILGERCYASLQEAQQDLAPKGVSIDIVDVFRRSNDVPPVADDAIAVGAKVFWLQMGIVNEAAAAKTRAAGMTVIMDRCLKVDYRQWRARRPR